MAMHRCESLEQELFPKKLENSKKSPGTTGAFPLIVAVSSFKSEDSEIWLPGLFLLIREQFEPGWGTT